MKNAGIKAPHWNSERSVFAIWINLKTGDYIHKYKLQSWLGGKLIGIPVLSAWRRPGGLPPHASWRVFSRQTSCQAHYLLDLLSLIRWTGERLFALWRKTKHTHTRIHIYMNTHTHIHTNSHTNTHTDTKTHQHTHTHTHTDTHPAVYQTNTARYFPERCGVTGAQQHTPRRIFNGGK